MAMYKCPMLFDNADPRIFGISFSGSGSSGPWWNRTDDAIGLTVSPYFGGSTSYASSFDEISPWKDIKVVSDPVAGELVEIPKFYYKISGDKKFQISMTQHDGFMVSPAHMDRGDGKGERDIVYVGRYKCASNYKSTSGVAPQTIGRNTFRAGIHSLGSSYWQIDFAMYWTLRFLFIVEMACTNSTSCVGAPYVEGSVDNTGGTDSMPYHTGTMYQNNRGFSAHTQYRYIEDLWGNVPEWCDGIYLSNYNYVYVIKNPSKFSDTANGTYLGKMVGSYGWLSDWTVPTYSGFEWALYPIGISGNNIKPIGDYFAPGNNANTHALITGGGRGRSLDEGGIFCWDSQHPASETGWASRIMKLP